MDGVMELLSGWERRRRWSVTDKLRIVAETQEPGARISGVAARHGVYESLVFSWRRQVRACGYPDANDLDDLRTDLAFKLACGRLPQSGDDLASQPTMSRWENATDLRTLILPW